DCQLDDEYRFAFIDNGFKLIYTANGATFNAGNLEPQYTCGADRSYESAFTFTTTADGVGIASITLPAGNPPDRFIGVTDVSSNNSRIISISATELVLRSGTTSTPVHQMSLCAKSHTVEASHTQRPIYINYDKISIIDRTADLFSDRTAGFCAKHYDIRHGQG